MATRDEGSERVEDGSQWVTERHDNRGISAAIRVQGTERTAEGLRAWW